MNLKLENEILRKKLEIAEKWIKREVLSRKNDIKISKINFFTGKNIKNFFEDNVEEIVSNNISNFIPEEIFIFLDKEILENLASAELSFFNLLENKNIDWLWVVSQYQKVFDLIIEEQVAKVFRKFFISKKINFSLKNDLDEKFLNSVIFEWYILWFWKLFSLLKKIKDEENLWFLASEFKEFLEKNENIWKILLEEEFLEIYEKIINLETFWSKRHIWKINFEEVKQTRELFLWDLKNENCLFFKLIWFYSDLFF